MEELTYSNLSEIKIESKLVGNVTFKPKSAPIICVVAGVAMLIPNNWLIRILGVFFIALGVVVIKLVEDRKIMDVYEDGVLIYRAADQNMAFFLKNDEIKMWKADRENGHDCITFFLLNDYRLNVETFQVEKAYDFLIKTLESKEERSIQREKNKKMKWANPIDTLRGLINRKKK